MRLGQLRLCGAGLFFALELFVQGAQDAQGAVEFVVVDMFVDLLEGRFGALAQRAVVGEGGGVGDRQLRQLLCLWRRGQDVLDDDGLRFLGDDGVVELSLTALRPCFGLIDCQPRHQCGDGQKCDESVFFHRLTCCFKQPTKQNMRTGWVDDHCIKCTNFSTRRKISLNVVDCPTTLCGGKCREHRFGPVGLTLVWCTDEHVGEPHCHRGNALCTLLVPKRYGQSAISEDFVDFVGLGDARQRLARCVIWWVRESSRCGVSWLLCVE